MASLTLRISGMTCSHCKMKVEQALKAVAGSAGASVFLPEGEAEVEFDAARATPAQFVEAVRRAGYTATVSE